MIREIIEKYIDNPNTRTEWEMASRGMIPMTPSIMKEFEENVDTAYHITNIRGLGVLKKIQKKKKQISAFTKGSNGIARGALSHPDYLVTLSGISSFDADNDIGSALSRNGYRWLYPSTIGYAFSEVMQTKIVQKYNLEDYMAIGSYVRELDGKGKHDFVKWYFDMTKKIMSKKLIKSLRDVIGDNNSEFWDNNEMFMYNIKIKDVKVIVGEDDDEGDDDYKGKEKIIKKLGLTYGGTIGSADISEIGN